MSLIDLLLVLLKLSLGCLTAACFVLPIEVSGQPGQSVTIDHLPLAVRDLDAAVEDLSILGFTIKQGRLHQNSIKNAHVKFADGSSLELITTTSPRDQLSQFYIQFISEGEGPAFIALEVKTLKSIENLAAHYNLAKTEGSYYTGTPSMHNIH